MLFREIKLLEGVPDAFVEFENFRGAVWYVSCSGDWHVRSADGATQSFALDDLLAWTDRLISGSEK